VAPGVVGPKVSLYFDEPRCPAVGMDKQLAKKAAGDLAGIVEEETGRKPL
jgi:hypothetical protein